MKEPKPIYITLSSLLAIILVCSNYGCAQKLVIYDEHYGDYWHGQRAWGERHGAIVVTPCEASVIIKQMRGAEAGGYANIGPERERSIVALPASEKRGPFVVIMDTVHNDYWTATGWGELKDATLINRGDADPLLKLMREPGVTVGRELKAIPAKP